MADAKQIVRSIAPLSQLISPRLFSKKGSGNIFMPFYHAIADSKMPHISSLYPVKNVLQFEKDLDFLLKYYVPIDLHTLIRHKNEDSKPTKPAFFLSFDDGLREFYSLIAPILKRKGVPATCFLNSAFIDNKQLFFRYQISLIIDCIQRHPKMKAPSLSKLSTRGNGRTEKENLLALTYDDRPIINQIGSELNIDFDSFLKEQKPYLDSSQIQTLIQEGFTFGAHSIDHPEYRFISEMEQMRQTKVSMDEVSKKFGLNYKAFSFPFTDHGVSKQLIEWMHHSCGIEISFGCAGHKRDSVMNHYQRVAFENGNLSAREIHNGEIAYSILRKSLGKNTIIR